MKRDPMEALYRKCIILWILNKLSLLGMRVIVRIRVIVQITDAFYQYAI
jgi:hypothetical protein